MGLRIKRGHGAREISVRLHQAGEKAIRSAREEMKRAADDIAEISQDQAPYLEGNLEGAIRVVKDYEGPNRRLAVSVEIDMEATGTGKNKKIGNYALAMHEGTYNLGPKSQAKQAGQTRRVGRKFLSRAFEEVKKGLINRMIKSVKKVI